MTLFPKAQRLEILLGQNFSSKTIFHAIAKYPENINNILSLLPEEHWLESFSTQDDAGNTVFHYAAQYPDSFGRILALLSNEQCLEMLKITNNSSSSVLSRVTDDDKNIEMISKRLPLFKIPPKASAASSITYIFFDFAI